MTVNRRAQKVCSRCGHTWLSYMSSPIRCPSCGTYHWQERPVCNVCNLCGHTWFSRSESIPTRCPKCKTRQWKQPEVVYTKHEERANVDSEILSMFESGMGCVSIAMATRKPVSVVIDADMNTRDDNIPLRM